MVHKDAIEKIINNILVKSDEFTYKCPKGYVSPKRLLERFQKNHENFREEEYTSDQDYLAEHPDEILGWDSPVGQLQQLQEDLQKNINYEHWDMKVIQNYVTSTFLEVNKYLNKSQNWLQETFYPKYDDEGNEYYEEDYDYLQHEIYLGNPWTNINNGEPMLVSVPEYSEMLSKAIDRSPRLAQDTVFYRWGEFPSDLKTGDKGVFKGFTSTSYNKTVAENIQQGAGSHWMDNNRKMIRIFAPKGTKGVVPTEELLCDDWQSEFLLDKNQKYIVVNNDDDVVDILLY